MEILKIYKDFKQIEPKYNKWQDEQQTKNKKILSLLKDKPVTEGGIKEQKRAKILIDALTSIDEYAQTKAEDIDSVSQTLLYVSVGALGTVGTYMGKVLSKSVKNPKVAKSLPSAMGIIFALATFLPVVRTTVVNQARANRIARFEGLHEKLFHLNNFALLTPEQQKQAENYAKNIPDKTINHNTSLINRSNIFNSLSVFKNLTMKQGEFAYLKRQHDKRLSEDSKKLKTVQFNENEIKQAKKDKKLFNDILQKVDMESHYPLERIEKTVNVAYSSLFAGGVLEYLASDGILNLFNVKNKFVRSVLSWGLPALTILFLNKQLANFLNDAVKAVRYKKMQEFVNDTNNFKEYTDEEINKVKSEPKKIEKTSFIKFFKETLKDIEDYKKYQNTKRLDEKKYALGVRNITLTKEQKTDAELLKRNAELTINALDDQTQKYSSAMETITESSTIPLDIIAPIIGTFTADKLHKHFSPNSRLGTLYKAIGAVVAFLPAALSEIYFVGQQRKALRVATYIAKNNLADSNKFLDPNRKEADTKNAMLKWNFNSGNKNGFFAFKMSDKN